MPFSFRAAPIDDRNEEIVTVMRGPVMLTAIDPPEQLEATAAALAHRKPVPGKPLEFECATAAGKVRLRPYCQLQREPYSTYFRRTAGA